MMFGLSPALAGAIAGAILGLISMAIILSIVARMEENAKSDEQRRVAGLLRNVAWLDVFLFTVVGYFIGPMIFG